MWLKVADGDPTAPRLGLGCLPFSGAYGQVEPSVCVSIVHYALDQGIRLLDAADFTAEGIGHRALAAAVASRRDEAVIAAHVGWNGHDALSEDLAAQCDEVLRRVGIEHVDLVILHGSPGGVPIEDRMGALAALVGVGKALHVGVYGVTVEQLRRAHATYPVAALSVELSLLQHRQLAEGVRAARDLGIGVLACRPLGRGFLTGQILSRDALPYGDARRADRRFSYEGFKAYQTPLRRLQEIAAGLDLSTGRLALAWLLSRGEDIVPLPGSTDRVHVEMNVSALGTRLTAETIRQLDGLFPAFAAGVGAPVSGDVAAD